MSRGNAGNAAPKRGSKGLSGTRILIFSAAAAVGVVAVRRSRGAQSPSPARDASPIPASASSVATSVTGNAPISSPVSVLKKVEPEPAIAPDRDASPVAEVEDDEEPPIWAGLMEGPASAPPRPTAPVPAFEAALTGAPVQYAQPFAPAPPLQPVPATSTIAPAPPAAPQPALSALSGEPWAPAPLGGKTRRGHGQTPPEGRQQGSKGFAAWSRTPKGRKTLVAIGIVCVVALVIAIILAS